MALHGDAKTFPLSAVVRMIAAEKKTGVLRVTSGKQRCAIYFKGGKIVFTNGNSDKDLRLGALLKANKFISETKLQQMLAVSQAMDKRLGTVLVERGYISQDDLRRLLAHQLKETITDAFTWDEAEFSYTDGLDDSINTFCPELDPVRLVNEALRWKEFRKIIPNDRVVFQIKPGALGSKSIYAARELRILLLLDGRRSVGQIIRETGYSRLAVYRALAQLHSLDAIVRKSRPVESGRIEKISETVIVGLYNRIFQVIMTDLGQELGDKRAAASFQASLKQSAYYGRWLRFFEPDRDLGNDSGEILARLRQRGASFSKRDLINGFNEATAGLLREESRLLGVKATRATVKRLETVLGNVPAEERLLTGAVRRFLGEEITQGLRRDAAGAGNGEGVTTRVPAAPDLPLLDLQKLGGRAIVGFYDEMFKVVIADLEKEVGAKARHLFEQVLKQSRHYETFFSQFDFQSGSGASVVRIRDQVKTRELKLSKADLVQAFQEVLLGFLVEEAKLLGPRAAQLTVSRLAEQMAGAQSQLKPLANHLSAFLASKTAKTEVVDLRPRKGAR